MPFSPPIDPYLEDVAALQFSADIGAGETTEGQLTVDVSQTAEEVIIVATMAGTNPGDISLHVHGDLLTIRGARASAMSADAKYLYQECYWGKFSRTLVLPMEVEGEQAQAEYKYGVLTIRIPKKNKDNEIPIEVMEE
jgi:HSP20 family protein